MASPSFNEFKRQASFFFKEKIKTARLVLTDVTPAQLLTEEATNGDSWAPDTRTMGLISRAAFEVDDYWRIVDIIHKRLWKFDKENWRASYKALLVLDHLLTHGPERVAEEFQCDRDVIKEMAIFQHVDEKGFNWGLRVREKSERIVKLLNEDRSFLKEERGRARKLTSGIKGFGSFSQRKSSQLVDERLTESKFGKCLRCNSHYENDSRNQDEEKKDSRFDEGIKSNEKIEKTEYFRENDHPFFEDGHHGRSSLLSS